jgi:glucose-1-phosphate thymidylyltransferase
MKCIILAAGYATRLYPLTENTPKPLLKIGSKTILSYILEKVHHIESIDEVFIVTNQKFYNTFLTWVNNYKYSKKIRVVNDGTTSNESRLGAIADIQFVIEQYTLNDDLLILAGDNLFDFELTSFVSFFAKHKKDSITTHEMNDIERLKRTGVIEVDKNSKVISFEEKPKHPKSKLAVPPFYIFSKLTIPLIKQYLVEGNNPDAPGNLIPWLIRHREVYAYKFSGERYDIGTIESYRECQKIFSDKSQ